MGGWSGTLSSGMDIIIPMPAELTDGAVPWWVRAVLWLAAAQALLLLLALVQPGYVSLLVPWPASPLNARFIASLYVALGAGVVLCSLAPRFREMRIVLAGIGVATALLLVLTVLRMSLHPHELARFPLFWLLFYVIDPLLVGLVFLRLGWGGSGARGRTPPRALWLVEAVLFGAAGLVLMLLPAVAQHLWPWTITEPQSQLYSAFFITLAVASLLAARERSWDGVRWLVFMIAFLALLVLGVSLLHLARFTRGGGTVTWMAVLAAEALVCGGLFVTHTFRYRSPAPAP
jgi:hypothetical protein